MITLLAIFIKQGRTPLSYSVSLAVIVLLIDNYANLTLSDVEVGKDMVFLIWVGFSYFPKDRISW